MAKIVVASSDPVLTESIRGGLQSPEHQVLTLKPDGDNMASILSRESPDVIILGVPMPGPDAVHLLLNIRCSADIPTFLFTNFGTPKGMLRNIDLSRHVCLSKPLAAIELKAWLGRALDRARENAGKHG